MEASIGDLGNRPHAAATAQGVLGRGKGAHVERVHVVVVVKRVVQTVVQPRTRI